MSKITVTIQRSAIYHIAEGISVSISQHNGGTPTYEQLWASPDESKKLDIYYREAISDLERQLTRWLQQASGQFDLTQNGTDYTLTLSVSRFWPKRLQGLLENKVQDYLVHAVTAGWLNDFAGLELKQDYKAMAGQDLLDIRSVIYKRDYSFRTGYRNEDNVTRIGNDELPPYCKEKNLRHRDNDIVDVHTDHTDWSGAGILYHDQPQSSPPPFCGRLIPRGVSIHHQPCRPCPPPPPCTPVAFSPAEKDPRIPDNPTHPNYPPIHADGIEWDDKALYDSEKEEHYVNNDN